MICVINQNKSILILYDYYLITEIFKYILVLNNKSCELLLPKDTPSIKINQEEEKRI